MTAVESAPRRGWMQRLPVFTLLLILVLVVVFAGEILTVPAGSPGAGGLSSGTIVRDGGLAWLLVARGQIWRLFTAPLLHFSVAHLVGNAIALLAAGAVFERLIGWRWFAASFALSALTGDGLSMLVNPANTIGVGASGGIIGLFATALVVSFHFERRVRVNLILLAVRIIVPALLPFAHQVVSLRTDIAAHGGGVIGGLAVGVLVLAAWRRDTRLPAFGGAAVVLPGLFFAIAALSLAAVTWTTIATNARLDATLPSSFETLKLTASTLIRSYPRDPRIRYAYAASLYEADRDDDARRALLQSLDDDDMMNLAPESEALSRALLGRIDLDAGRREEAYSVAAPLCAASEARYRLMAPPGTCPAAP